MKHISEISLLWMALLAFSFMACSDDSSSTSANSSNPQKETAELSVDEKNKMFTIIEEREKTLCVKKDASYSVETFAKTDTSQYKYGFIGDTLYIFFYSEFGFSSSDGIVFVGGTPGKLYGKWKLLLNCGYDTEENKIECYEDSESSEDFPVKAYYIFSSDKINVEYEVDSSLLFTEYSKSQFIYELYSGFYSGVYYYLTSDLFSPNEYLTDVNAKTILSTEFGIDISKQTDNSVTFSINGKTIQVDILKAVEDEYIRNVNVKVSMDDKTCELDYTTATEDSVNVSLCKAKNAEYFELDYSYDEKGNEFDYVYKYKKLNIDSYKVCVKGLMAETKVEADIPVLYKKSNLSKDEIDERIKDFNRKIQVFSK